MRTPAAGVWRIVAGLLLLPCLVAGTAAADVAGTVVFNDRTKAQSGQIVAVSPLNVEVGEKKIPIERIADVEFDDEPSSMKAARRGVLRGEAAQAEEDLKKIATEQLDEADQLLRDELTFIKAAVAGLKGLQAGAAQLGVGEKAVRDYLAKHGSSSHHAFFMHELNGRILARGGKFDEAAKAYAPFDKGPPAYQVRGRAARGGVLFDQGKFAEAMAEYDAAAKTETDPRDDASAVQKREAELGIARCLARQGKPQEAIDAAQAILKNSDPEDGDILGRAYNVLGDAYRAANKDQDAVIAYLTVDLVYNSSSANREEALFNLADLWERGKYAERARDARQQLESTYPNSPWIRKLKGGAAAP
jgi:tetratricopeptide (TPR) repeat protein